MLCNSSKIHSLNDQFLYLNCIGIYACELLNYVKRYTKLTIVKGACCVLFFYPGIFCVTKLILSFVEWSDENPPASNILRLIYQGRFLHGNVTLGGNSSHHYMPWWQVLFIESFAKILMQSVLYDVLACFFLVREKSVRGIDRFERISTFFSVIMSVVKNAMYLWSY